MEKGILSVWLVTVYLVFYTVVAYLEISVNLVFILFSISPFLVIWMVISVLKSNTTKVRELKEDEEWGYQDIS